MGKLITMSNLKETTNSELDQRRTREIEIDVLIGHECASRSPVSKLLWERAGLDPPSGLIKVEYQQLCGDGRFVDVRVTAHDGRQLLIEDKAAGGVFQKGQVENYQRITTDKVRTILIAPASFLSVHQREARCFCASVSLEEISDALKSAPEDAEAELADSYAHRREEFLRCAKDIGWVGNPDENVRAFGECYRRFAIELTGGEITLTPSTLTNATARMVEFVPWAPKDNFKPFHKLDKGFIDVRVKGFSLQELRERVDGPETRGRCPKGWKVAAQNTRSAYPVLRYRVGAIGGDLSMEAFDTVRHIVAEALHALSDLKSWWEQEGARLLPILP
jgi:hypothetical protein